MKTKYLLSSLFALLLAIPLGAFGQGSNVTVDILETFDYPGTGNQTEPQKINDNGDVAGLFIDASGATRAFFRTRSGNFSDPITEPNDTANFTQGRGLNNSRVLCGDYTGSDGLLHGFFLSGHTFSEFDVADSQGSEVLGINNAGDFAGNFVNSNGSSEGFLSVGGTVTSFLVPGTTFTAAYQLNGFNESVGYYSDSSGATHGFLRAADGTLTFPIDPAGSTGTILFGNNDQNWVVGRYSDISGATHGLVLIAPNRYITFDYPGSTFTSLNGINNSHYVCGRYVDTSGVEHGFIGRVKRSGGSGSEIKTLPTAPVKPGTPLPAAERLIVPAS